MLFLFPVCQREAVVLVMGMTQKGRYLEQIDTHTHTHTLKRSIVNSKKELKVNFRPA